MQRGGLSGAGAACENEYAVFSAGRNGAALHGGIGDAQRACDLVDQAADVASAGAAHRHGQKTVGNGRFGGVVAVQEDGSQVCHRGDDDFLVLLKCADAF